MCEFFHIPFQSGDNDVLREMKYEPDQELLLLDAMVFFKPVTEHACLTGGLNGALTSCKFESRLLLAIPDPSCTIQNGKSLHRHQNWSVRVCCYRETVNALL